MDPGTVAQILERSDPSSVVANIAGWLAEAIQYELSMGVSAATIAATLTQWMGLGGTAYGLKGTEIDFVGAAPLLAQCLKHAAIGQSAVEALIIAVASIIPSAEVYANRAQQKVLIALNFIGQNTPAIVAHEAQYVEYWGQNSKSGVGLGTTLNMLSGLLMGTAPVPITPPGASSAGPAAAGESAVQSSLQGSSEIGGAGEAMSTPGNMLGQLLEPVQQGVSTATGQVKDLVNVPMQGFQSISQSGTGMLQTFMGGMFPGMSQSSNAAAAEAAAVEASAGPIGAGGGAAASGLGAGGSAGSISPALTSFTRPTSTFEPESVGGRAIGLRPGGFLNAAELRGPTATAPMGGAPMPVSPATGGMLGRENADADKVTHARIVVDGDGQDPQ